jgi:hypothetical protein
MVHVVPVEVIAAVGGVATFITTFVTIAVFTGDIPKWFLFAWLGPVAAAVLIVASATQPPAVTCVETLHPVKVEIPGHGLCQFVADGEKVVNAGELIGHRLAPDGCVIEKTAYEQWYGGVRWDVKPTYRVVEGR